MDETGGADLLRSHVRMDPGEDARQVGDPVAIAEYLGSGDTLDQSVREFSLRYADQNERDLEDCIKAIRSGRVDAVEGI